MVLSETICKIHSREYALLTGNGTTALYLTFKALGLYRDKIAVPNNVCFNVIVAILLTENIPVYVDVNEQSMNITPAELQKLPSGIKALIAVHSYGNCCDMSALDIFCKKNNWFLIEDVAVAQGAVHQNLPAGSFGDISILSFGAGKIIDIGHGGALLTNNQVLFEKAKYFNQFIKEDSSKDIYKSTLRTFYLNLYNRYYGHYPKGTATMFVEKIYQIGLAFFAKFAPCYTNILSQEIQNLAANIAKRNENVEKLNYLLKDLPISVFQHQSGSVYWRYNFLIENRNKLLRQLLSLKFKVSSWYPSVDALFKEPLNKNYQTLVSDKISQKILNIWINHEIDDQYLQGITSEIKNFIEPQK